MNASRRPPGAPGNEMSKPESQVWQSMLEAALRVYRYHAKKFEASIGHNTEPSARTTEHDVSESASASRIHPPSMRSTR